MTSRSICSIIKLQRFVLLFGGDYTMKVAIYCRLSEEDRNKQFETDDSNSIQNQKAMLKQYADEQGWDVYEIYSDDDYTGSDRRRPAFNRLLKDAEDRKFNIVLCMSSNLTPRCLKFDTEKRLFKRQSSGYCL